MRWMLSIVACLLFGGGFCQTNPLDSQLQLLKEQKDSTLKVLLHADSLRTDREFAEKEKWIRLKAAETFPLINAGTYSGVLPVKDPTEIPDPHLQYKLLFEVTQDNPDSMTGQYNLQLVEVARILNLHIASGIALKNITPVIVVHGPALKALTGDDFYRKKFNIDNPNRALIDELTKAGARFIACGQAMQMQQRPKESLLPEVHVSLTAQTVLSSYRLRGFVLMELK
jgi:intracellular sulfur oxidation DsrE/DsrF family protein